MSDQQGLHYRRQPCSLCCPVSMIGLYLELLPKSVLGSTERTAHRQQCGPCRQRSLDDDGDLLLQDFTPFLLVRVSWQKILASTHQRVSSPTLAKYCSLKLLVGPWCLVLADALPTPTIRFVRKPSVRVPTTQSASPCIAHRLRLRDRRMARSETKSILFFDREQHAGERARAADDPRCLGWLTISQTDRAAS
jgi:hypothetical protein